MWRQSWDTSKNTTEHFLWDALYELGLDFLHKLKVTSQPGLTGFFLLELQHLVYCNEPSVSGNNCKNIFFCFVDNLDEKKIFNNFIIISKMENSFMNSWSIENVIALKGLRLGFQFQSLLFTKRYLQKSTLTKLPRLFSSDTSLSSTVWTQLLI